MTRHAWTMPQYLQSRALGSSSVHRLTLSALDYHAETVVQKVPKPGSDAAIGGSLCHSIVLQPETVADEYPIWVTTHQSGANKGKARVRRGSAWDEFVAAHPGKTIVTDKMMLIAEQISERALANKQLQELLRAPGEAEVSWTWWRIDCIECGWSQQVPYLHQLPCNCRSCGALSVFARECKKRPDFETADVRIDLKLTRATSAHQARREGYKYGWGIKERWYSGGGKALGRDKPFYFLVVQNVSPYDVALMPVTRDEMEESERDIKRAMARLAACEASGQWPGPLAPLAAEGYERPHWGREDIELEHDEAEETS